MEHCFTSQELEAVRDAIPPIPWLGFDHRKSSTRESFDDYALQHGWNEAALQNLKDGNLSDLDKDRLVPFLQSWFSFGLLEVFLDTGLDPDAFIVYSDEQPHFSSEALRQINKDVQERYRSSPKDDPSKVDDMKHFTLLLNEASNWCRILRADRFIAANPDICDESFHSVLRMFTLLGLTVQYAAQNLAQFMTVNFRGQLQNNWGYTNVMRSDLWDRMRKSGWCPFMQTFMHPYSQLVIEYAAIVGPPAKNIVHQKCTRTTCTVHDIDETTYKPKHTQENCDCAFVRPDLDAIREALENEQIPLIDLTSIRHGSGGKTVEVVPANPRDHRFCAVSHVWSSGLGSLAEDGLPECTLRSLARQVRQAGDYDLIWIDSLCIPRERELRKVSVRRMNNIYKWSKACLIIDPDMSRAQMPNSKQMIVWLITSAWMQRMWTLPEGRLSADPYLVFSDSAKRYLNMIAECQQQWDNPVSGALDTDLFALFRNEAVDLRSIHQSLSYRTTSKAQDEAPALAILFEIDPTDILNTNSNDDRMALFWKGLEDNVNIPTNILFLSGRKLIQHGLRWAPKTLLNVGPELTLIRPPAGTTQYSVKKNADGSLTGTYPVIKLTKPATISLTTYNPIRIYVVKDNENDAQMYAELTISAVDGEAKAANHGIFKSGEVQGIDAFAVNIWNREATTRELLARELAATQRSIVALTQDYSGTYRFIYRYRMLLMPLRSIGKEMISGVIGWKEITIS